MDLFFKEKSEKKHKENLYFKVELYVIFILTLKDTSFTCKILNVMMYQLIFMFDFNQKDGINN